MPQASSFSIENSIPAAVIFSCLQPAGGNLPAIYQAPSAGPNVASQPKIAISSNGTAKTREVKITVRTPYWVTGSDGATKVVDSCFTDLKFTLPETVPALVRADHAAYVANLLNVASVREAIMVGYAPT